MTDPHSDAPGPQAPLTRRAMREAAERAARAASEAEAGQPRPAQQPAAPPPGPPTEQPTTQAAPPSSQPSARQGSPTGQARPGAVPPGTPQAQVRPQPTPAGAGQPQPRPAQQPGQVPPPPRQPQGAQANGGQPGGQQARPPAGAAQRPNGAPAQRPAGPAVPRQVAPAGPVNAAAAATAFPELVEGGARPPRRNRRRGSIASFVVMIVILVGLFVLAFTFVPRLFGSGNDGAQQITDFPGPGAGEVQIEVPSGASGQDIGLILKDAGVVATVDAFSAAYNANPNATSIQPGTYALPVEMRAADAVSALLDPNRRSDVKITIPEGYTAAQIYQRIADIMGVPVSEVTEAAHDYAALGLDGPPNTNPDAIDPMEGWLYPSTYSVAPGTTPSDVIKQMYDRTISELDNLGVAPEDRLSVLTLGSIAIKELRTPEDWGMAVRTMLNRMENASGEFASRLGADTVLQYAWNLRHPGETMPGNEHNTSSDPYNTRLIAGLPPSPIASVDSRVLAAAANPPEGDWGYWITVNYCTGESYFTTTYDEFLSYKAQLQAWEKEWNDADRVCPDASTSEGDG